MKMEINNCRYFFNLWIKTTNQLSVVLNLKNLKSKPIPVVFKLNTTKMILSCNISQFCKSLKVA